MKEELRDDKSYMIYVVCAIVSMLVSAGVIYFSIFMTVKVPNQYREDAKDFKMYKNF